MVAAHAVVAAERSVFEAPLVLWSQPRRHEGTQEDKGGLLRSQPKLWSQPPVDPKLNDVATACFEGDASTIRGAMYTTL